MEVVNNILEVNLLEKYSDERKQEYRQSFLNKVKSIDTHPKFKVGQIISFIAGYHNNIRYTTEIIGFNKEGGLYLLWDCYWFPVRDEPIREIKIK